MKQLKTHYRQRLPHIQPIGACFFITFNLHGSIHPDNIRQIRNEYYDSLSKIEKSVLTVKEANRRKFLIRKKIIVQYHELLDSRKSGPRYLAIDKIAHLCVSQLKRFDGEFYDLIAYCIMNNHIHMLIDTQRQIKASIQEGLPLDDSYTNIDVIMKRIKGPIGKIGNKILGRQGQFWSRESYDIYIRNEMMLGNVIRYIINNPVKAGLVSDWQDHPFTYVHKDYSMYN